MKITLTGSLGNISKPLAEILIAKGHNITIISSDPNKKLAIEALGAKAAIGTIADTDFLADAFKGADAIYTMVPPSRTTSSYRQYIAESGRQYSEAIKAAGVKYVVNLSSIGAHLNNGTGPIAGLHDVEEIFNTLDGVAVKHVRAGFFFTNFFHDAGMIRNLNIMGGNYSGESKLVLVHPKDIAAAAAEELEALFEAKSYRYVVGDEQRMADIASLLGAAIGKPELPWVQFSDEDTFAGMTGAGMSEALASVYVEMNRAVGSGILFEDFQLQEPKVWTATKLTDFAKEFAGVYNAQ